MLACLSDLALKLTENTQYMTAIPVKQWSLLGCYSCLEDIELPLTGAIASGYAICI